MSYNPEAQIFQNQVVINDTTNGGITSGGLVVKGGLSTQDTFVTGHVAINDVKITPNLNDIVNEIERNLSNSITEFTDITDFSFDNSVTNSFKAQVAVTVSGASSKYAIWEMFGVYKPNGWSMTSSFTGDITGVVFRIADDTINGRGKIQYTNSNASGTTTIKFRAITTQPPGSSPTGSTEIINNTSGPFVVDTLVFANTSSNITSSNITYISDVLTINGSDRIVGENANQFTNFSNGGAITSMGDMSVARNLIIGSKIGISKTAPGFSLDVSGDINFTGTFYQNGSPYSGSSIWQTNANTVFYTTGNLGLGTTDPTVRLDVVGNIKSTNLNASSGITTGVLTASGITAGNINFTGDLYKNGSVYASSPWTTDQNSIYYNSVGFVGIGTTVPGKKLDVVGDIRASAGITSANISATVITVGSLVATNSRFTNSTFGSIISGGGTVGGHFVPSTSGSYDLGSASNRWKDLYLSGNTINLDGQTISLNTSGNFDLGSSKLVIGGETLVATNGSFQIGETITSTTLGNVINFITSGNLNYEPTMSNFVFDVSEYSYDDFIITNDSTTILFTGSEQKTYNIRLQTTLSELTANFFEINKNFTIRIYDSFQNRIPIQTIYTSPNITLPGNFEPMTPYNIDTGFIEVTLAPGNEIQFYIDGTGIDNSTTYYNAMSNTIIQIQSKTTSTVEPNNIMSVTNVTATNSTINSIVASTVSSGTLYLSSNAVIGGNLTVSGTTVSTNTDNVNIKDNIIILNNEPAGLYDAGVMMQITQGNYASMYYDNATEDFNFIRTSSSAGTTITPENWVGLRVDHLHVLDTTNATGLGTGGSLNVQGGASIMKDMYVGGNFAASGAVTSSSDVRLKENIETISGALDKIQQCRGVRYTKKATGQTEIGFIAQELEEMFPELVITDSNGYKSVAYGNVTAVLVECVKELKKELDELRNN